MFFILLFNMRLLIYDLGFCSGFVIPMDLVWASYLFASVSQ